MARQIVHIPAQRNVIGRNIARQRTIRVAPYCRVCTDQVEQLNSFENQVSYYKDYVNHHPDYVLVDIYTDEGISGTSTKRRDDFNRMIADCRAKRKISIRWLQRAKFVLLFFPH